MNKNSKLVRSDYDDFLVYLYFGPKADLEACINRAYLDFCRTLNGISKLPDDIFDRAKGKVARDFSDLKKKQISDSEEFDDWHESICKSLIAFYMGNGYPNFYIGQAQKWINMTFKYIFVLGENRINGYGELYPFCHVPIDNILIRKLKEYSLPFSSASNWSRLNDYREYLDFQKKVRQRFALAPLDVEFWLWLDKEVPTN